MLEKNQREHLTRMAISAIGIEKLEHCSKSQLELMDTIIDEQLDELDNDPTSITEAQLLGIYEIVVDHLLPDAVNELLNASNAQLEDLEIDPARINAIKTQMDGSN